MTGHFSFGRLRGNAYSRQTSDEIQNDAAESPCVSAAREHEVTDDATASMMLRDDSNRMNRMNCRLREITQQITDSEQKP